MEAGKELEKNVKVGDFRVVIELLSLEKELRYSKDNNVFCVKDGRRIWGIEELLRNYSNKNHINYVHELYFDIVKVDDDKIRCIGFYNHCIIDVCKQEIVSIMNNR